jgi:hypothetical protein
MIKLIFSIGLFASGAGVHGYRSRNRWFYLIHLALAMFLSLCSFAVFISALVQFRKIKSHANDNITAGVVTTLAPETTNTTDAIMPTPLPQTAEEATNFKEEVHEMVQTLGFPTAICFFHITLYLISGRYAYKAWQDSCGNPQMEILDEEPEIKQDPIS